MQWFSVFTTLRDYPVWSTELGEERQKNVHKTFKKFKIVRSESTSYVRFKTLHLRYIVSSKEQSKQSRRECTERRVTLLKENWGERGFTKGLMGSSLVLAGKKITVRHYKGTKCGKLTVRRDRRKRLSDISGNSQYPTIYRFTRLTCDVREKGQ